MTARVYRADADDARRTGERPIARGVEDRELVRLRVLWYALRARGMDAAGAPGIAYDRPVVQSSPQQPAAPHGYGMGHARDSVQARLDALCGTEEAVTLRWYRAHDAAPALTAGRVSSILDALVRDVASVAEREAWAAVGVKAGHEGGALLAHLETQGRVWARARMRRAIAAWQGEAAEAAEGTGT